jgi:rhodanese-related sulfurtransferase
LPNSAPDIEIVTVGYRAAELATRLRAAGFTRVQCLDGSIFQRANEHRPLVLRWRSCHPRASV